ncbi:Nucleolar and coiled-body phospho 1 [Chlorella sorokiniana]|uniref:Nucleolar and coiled-body phospho 1 n=1 Tax=Chlorella sorokiniana TaxID=3076 RepID=A0A2P6U0U7_CHLSO|nr:Nucleolar and coiled-body phospho 1 [Chlorella sorokiniana]|eukprot:PRW59918.1 Nucleolar and coiled-body phospho 1 [Chlorella sorokiniana]
MAKKEKKAAAVAAEPAAAEEAKTQKKDKKEKKAKKEAEAEPAAAPTPATDEDSKAARKKEKKEKKGKKEEAAAAPAEAEADKPAKKEKKEKKRKREAEEAATAEAPAAAAEAPAAEAANGEAKSSKKKKEKKEKKKGKKEEAAAAADEEPAATAAPAKKRKTDVIAEQQAAAAADDEAAQQAAEPQAGGEEQEAGGATGGRSDGGYGSSGKEGTAAKAFQRVKADEWLDKKGAWDNSYEGTFGRNGWGWKAQEVLGKVRGKDFRHEKTKKKRGSYKGGDIDPHARCSYKFESDDDAKDLTLDAGTFAALGGSTAEGALPVTYRSTECRPPAGSNITMTVLDYRASEGGYLRLVLSSVAGSSGIQTVEARQTPLAGGKLDIVASAWRRMINQHGAAWELSGIPVPPLDLRVTDGAGRQVILRRVITEAGRTGSFNSTAQFPLEDSPAGVAAAGAASLSHPEVAALALPRAPAGEPALAASAPNSTAADPEAPQASPPAAEASASPASGAGPAQDSEATAFVAAQEAQEAPLAAPSLPANSSSLAGADCSTTLDLLDSHASFSIFRSLIATAGNAWMQAVGQFPLLRYDAEALRTTLLQHIIVGPQDFSSSALLRYDALSGLPLSIKKAATNSSTLLIVSQASAASTLQEGVPTCASLLFPVTSVLLPSI